jgi:DNA-binding NarL/FixJ family response regulator
MTLSIIFSAASLLICGFTFIYLQAYLRRRTGAERILADFEEEVNKIIAGIDAAADRDITLLEDKAKSIRALLETLDRRIAAYARELDRRNTPESPRNAEGARTEVAYAALGRGLRSTLKVNSPEPAPAAEITEPRFIRSANPVKTKTPLSEQVLELSRNGFSEDTIAARLGVTLAEVDLALAMPERPPR